MLDYQFVFLIWAACGWQLAAGFEGDNKVINLLWEKWVFEQNQADRQLRDWF